jgi:hypothetical protein
MDDAPDIYADQVTVGANPVGITLVLLLSDIAGDGTQGPNRVVGRVRMGIPLAKALGGLLINAAAEAEKAAEGGAQFVQGGSTVKH